MSMKKKKEGDTKFLIKSLNTLEYHCFFDKSFRTVPICVNVLCWYLCKNLSFRCIYTFCWVGSIEFNQRSPWQKKLLFFHLLAFVQILITCWYCLLSDRYCIIMDPKSPTTPKGEDNGPVSGFCEFWVITESYCIEINCACGIWRNNYWIWIFWYSSRVS